MTADTGPEPTGWELLRGLKEVKDAVAVYASGQVSQAAFKAVEDRLKRVEEEQVEQTRARARMWASIGVAVVVAVIGLAVTLSLRGLGVTP